MAKLNSNSFATLLDLLSEGEIQGLKDGKKSIYLNNVELLNKNAILKTGTYSQAGGTITVLLVSHGYSVNDLLVLDVTSGNTVSDTYKVLTAAADTFTVAAKDQTTTSGSVTISKSSDYNFQNVTVYTRNGTNNQTYIPDTNEISNEIGVGVKVLKDNPVVRTITDQTTNAVRITLGFPRLQSYGNDGGIGGASVQINIEVQYNGGGYTLLNGFPDTVTGRSDDNYQKDYIVNLNGAFPVDIRVSRVTADSTSPKKIDEFNWSSYTEITYAKLRYPNSALASIRFSAEQFSSIPQRAYQIRGIKVAIPSNATVDSSTGALIYSGTWDGLFQATKQWTSDPAWCLWALLTNTRFGFGNYLNTALLDKWAFFQCSQYASALNTYTSSAEIAERAARGLSPRTGTTNDYNATTGMHGVPDGFGNYEPRFSCNVNIQTQEEAYTLINNLCSVFRAMPFWSAGSLTATQDKPTASSYLFTLANVSEGGFSYSGSSQKSRPTVVVVSYFDMTMRDVAYEYVEDQAAIAKYGVNTKKIDAFACTSRGQANRLGRWVLEAASKETEVVAFTASIDSGVILRPGQVIDIADPVRAGSRRGGRISSATTTTVTVDDATDLTTANSPTLSVILPNGTVETKPVSSISGKVITVSSAFSVEPNSNSIWVFESTNLQASQWRVISVTEQDDFNYAINALTYNSSKYDNVEYGLALTTRSVLSLNTPPATPTSLSFFESLYTFQSQVKSKIVIGWLPVVGVQQYQIRWRKDYGNWSIDTSQGADYEIFDTPPGLYEVEVYSVGSNNLLSLTALTGSVQALGKVAPPSDITNFTAILDPNIGVTLTWDPAPDLDLQGYEIWQGAAWNTGTKIGLLNVTSTKVGLIPASATTTWWIKALDTSGSYSTTAASTSITTTATGQPVATTTIANDTILLKWTEVQGSLSTAYYEIRSGLVTDTWPQAAVVGTVQATTYSIVGNWIGTKRFFIVTVDIAGNKGTNTQFFDVTINAPSQPIVTQQVVDNNVLLYWKHANEATASTLPITAYEIRKGSTYATSTLIGLKSGRFTTVFETTGGIYTYWVTGVDSAGNYGTPGSISAQVNQPPDYVLQSNLDSTFNGGIINGVVDGGMLYVNVNSAVTWATHFSNGAGSGAWTTLQAQIDAGFPYLFTPSLTAGVYVEEIDYGVALSNKITTILTSNNLVPAGSTATTSFTPSISTSGVPVNATNYSRTTNVITVNTVAAHGLVAGNLVYLSFATGGAVSGTYAVATIPTTTQFTVASTGANIATQTPGVSWAKWTTYSGLNSVFATNFRRVRVQYDFSSTGNNNLLQVTNLNVKLDSKLRNDAGSGQALAADTGGTTVLFNVPFIDVASIAVTPLATTSVVAVYDFVDVPNPTSFKVLLFNSAGTRVDGAFSWSARGV